MDMQDTPRVTIMSDIVAVLSNPWATYTATFNRISDILPVASAQEIDLVIAAFQAGRQFQQAQAVAAIEALNH